MPYDEYYSEENLNIPTFIQQRLKEIASGFAPYRTSNRLLEVGFGEGSFLAAAMRAGWDAEGIEVSKTAVEHARSAGLKVYCASLPERNYPDGHFDVIIASELIEHLADPRSFLIEIARILRPGGLFWATTPNSSGVSAKAVGLDWTVICPPEHLQLFSAQGVRQLLTEAGFSNIRIAAHGVNLFEIIHHYRAPRRTNRTPGTADAQPVFDRVGSGYKLNENLTTNRTGRMVKTFANSALRFTGLGDSLKITAVK
jgi:SAM-dependent methyltransferase